MTEPAFDDDDLDAPLTYVEIVQDDLDEAANNLEEQEVMHLCIAIRKKISAMLDEHRRRRPSDASDAATEESVRWP